MKATQSPKSDVVSIKGFQKQIYVEYPHLYLPLVHILTNLF